VPKRPTLCVCVSAVVAVFLLDIIYILLYYSTIGLHRRENKKKRLLNTLLYKCIL
jgi:hypothetical protein